MNSSKILSESLKGDGFMTTATLSTRLKEQVKEYHEALSVIREFLSQDSLATLEEALNRLESLRVNIAVFGETNSGKSALLNSLFGCNNDEPENCLFKVDDKINCWSRDIELSNGKVWSHHGDLIITLYDTPGIAGDIENHLDIAMKIVEKSDIVLYVVFEPVRNKLQVPVMKRIIESGKPVIVVINKVDIRRSREVTAIRQDLLSKFKLEEQQIVECAGYPKDGSPKVESLVKGITKLVNQHQSDLIDKTVRDKLNLGIEDARQILIQRAERERELLEKQKQEELRRYDQEKQERMVMNHWIIHGSASGAAATGAALSQVPGGNEAALTAITTLMIGMLCANYNKLSRSLIWSYLGIISGTLIGKTAASYAWRFFPGVGNIIEGVVTFALHEGQGWFIAALLENGIYSDAQLKSAGIDNLKKQAEEMKKSAKSLERSMDTKKLKELRGRLSTLETKAREAQA
ncbi:MAG: 50S ribosome-binding GTPase [Burkholderiales bacterium]|nr:50S ribosome-binding GTPase [Burkholderiales bacterium]